MIWYVRVLVQQHWASKLLNTQQSIQSSTPSEAAFKTIVVKIYLMASWLTFLHLYSACPLANSRYATIREEEGICYLYMKTAERAHTPKHLWEKIKLPANYSKALDLVSEQLEHFPKYLVHRNKQRLTKIHQMLIRMRKLKLRAK